jgi:phage tail-like protein
MAVLRDTPYGSFNFLVDLGTGAEGPTAGFAEVTLPEAAVDVIEYRNGNERQSSSRKIPGRAHYSNVVLKRGVIGSLDLYEWWSQVRNGDMNARRNVLIQLQSEDRTAIVLSWRLRTAFPVRYHFSTLDASSQAPLVEYLELAFEDLQIE